MCSRRCSKSIGPTDIFLRLGVLSFDLGEVSFPLGLNGDFALVAPFIRELAVDAKETGCRGRELLNGGESFGGGIPIYAWSRVLLFGVTKT